MAEGVKIAARNQKAFHEYFIDEKFEAGIELTGTEVKSIRLGTLSLKAVSYRTGSFSSGRCTSRPMSRAISSTKTRFARAGCSCTSVRSCGCTAR